MEFLSERTADFTVIEYLKDTFTKESLETLIRQLNIPAMDLIRKNEQEYKEHFRGERLSNKEKALQLLRSQLYELELRARLEKRSEIEAGKKKIEWGSQIRNYVMHPYKLVKDVRTGVESVNVDGVMNGEIDEFLKAFLMMYGN